MTRTVRRLLAATAATASLLAVTGCGDDDDSAGKASSSASDSADAGADASADESDSAEPADDQAEGESISGEEFADLLQTALDQATTAHLTMEMGELGTGEGDVDYSQQPPAMSLRMTMDAMGGDVELRMVDGTIYLKGASFGDQWVSMSLDDPSSPLGGLGSSLDLTQQFETFAAAVTEATFTGSEDVDGESLDHYTATVDTAALVGQVPGGGDTTGMPETMTQDWWFDDEGRIRRFASDLGGMAGQVDISMSDWGQDVTIEAPPADEVTPMGQAAS